MRIIQCMNIKQGKIVIEPSTNIWPHELKTATALAKAGYTVTFVRKSEIDYEKTADVLIDEVRWEFKSPTADNLKAIERNLKRARWQSHNIVFDSRRMHRLPESAIRKEVHKQLEKIKGIDKLLYIDNHGNVIDMK